MVDPSRSYLVTGGAGFIGSHVARRLVTEGGTVRVVDNLSTGFHDNLADIDTAIEFVEGDLRDPEVCRRVTSGVDTVFHLAALPSVPRSMADPWASFDHNVTATARLLIACRDHGVRRMVYSSSSSIYGDTPVLPKVETSEPLPRSPYAAAKLSAEQHVLAFARAQLVEGIALRYFNVFGPWQRPGSAYSAVIPEFLNAALAGEPVRVHGDGTQTRDFTYIDNVVQANLLAATLPAERVSGWSVNVGAGERTSVLQLIELMEEVTKRPISVVHQDSRPGDVRDSLASLERATELLGYTVEIPLKEGLRQTWPWIQVLADRAASAV